jgi:uncharacterized protein (DUF1778 family)
MPTTGAQRRTAKLSLRLTDEQRDYLNRAALLATSGDMTRFVADAALKAAKLVIEEHGVSQLAEENRARFYDLLLNPPQPSRALADLAAANLGAEEHEME